MVDRKDWGKLREYLELYSGTALKEFCYIFELPRSGRIDQKINRILQSEYSYEYVADRLNFLDLGIDIMQHYSSKELTEILRENGLARHSRIWDKMIEIIKSEGVTPRMLLGQLSTDKIEEIYGRRFGELPTDDRDECYSNELPGNSRQGWNALSLLQVKQHRKGKRISSMESFVQSIHGRP